MMGLLNIHGTVWRVKNGGIALAKPAAQPADFRTFNQYAVAASRQPSCGLREKFRMLARRISEVSSGHVAHRRCMRRLQLMIALPARDDPILRVFWVHETDAIILMN